jgi:pimeloyl-ACP methyl ester carboxylesterase
MEPREDTSHDGASVSEAGTIPGDTEAPLVVVDLDERSDAPPPRGLVGLLTDVLEANAASSDDDVCIRVRLLEGPDGQDRYTAAIPGSWGEDPLRLFATEDEGGNPFDWNQNLPAVTGRITDSSRAVRAAIGAVGVPVGAELVLAGHSQGGIVAANLAADPSVNGPGGWRISHVISAGGPVQNAPVLAPTVLVNVDHDSRFALPSASAEGLGRWLPHLVAGDPIPESDQLTAAFVVRHELPEGRELSRQRIEVALPAREPGGLSNHMLELYIESVAEELAAHPDGLLAGVEASDGMQRVLGPRVRSVRTADVHVSRVV